MRAYLREIGEELQGCELTHLEREPIDFERAQEQQRALVRCLGDLGCDVELWPALPGHPDAPFVEDVALLLGAACVVTQPGASTRRGELVALRGMLGERYEMIELPQDIAGTQGATLDGGDVLRIEDTLYVGQSTRTNHAGLKSLAHAVLREGLRVKAAPVHGCLHLKTGASYLGKGRVLAHPDWVDLSRMGDVERVAVDPAEPMGANLLRVGDQLLGSASFPRTNERLRTLGYDVHELELGEMHKAEAGITCMVLCDPWDDVLCDPWDDVLCDPW